MNRLRSACSILLFMKKKIIDQTKIAYTLQHTADTLQHTATHCSTLQHIATHCNTLQHIAIQEGQQQ